MKTLIKISALAKAGLIKKISIPALVLGAFITIWALNPESGSHRFFTSDNASKANNKASKNDLQNSTSIDGSALSEKSTDQDTSDENKTLSPYFIVLSEDPAVDQLPLKSTSADVSIAGVIADVEITQTYKNTGKNTLEAIYTFPASPNAAVYSMEMAIGKRKITAVIKEKNKARQEYEEAKENGNRASLLEESRPNVFQMNVANISPGDEIMVSLKYTELLVPESGVYEFVYPTVVGPRYSNKSENSASQEDKFVAAPYTKSGSLPTYTFDLNASISAGMPIQSIDCNSHNVNITYPDKNSATICLDSSETKGGNRDFVLDYKLAGEKIETGMLLYDNGDEKFFLMMVQPPKKVEIEDIPPREYVFIVDASGSMNGFPLDISKKLLRNLITNLRPIDKFNVIVFSNSSELLSESSLFASSENVEKALDYIDSKQGACGTEILPALEKALALPRATTSLSRSFVLLTDGYVDVEKESFDLIRNNLDKANFFAFGIGTSVNTYLIQGMAHAGMGEPLIVTKKDFADEKCEKFRQYIASPVLTEIKRDFGKFQAYDVEPLSSPDILAERPVVIFGKYKGEAKGTITIKGHTGISNYKTSFDVSTVKADGKNAALRYLWAREKIKFLDDYTSYVVDSAKVKEVTDLGLKYNLLTAYTSFIAVDKTEIVDKNGKLTTVETPLPLPQDVSDYAVGADIGLDDETADFLITATSVYSEILIPTDLDATLKEVAMSEIETALDNNLNNYFSTMEVFGLESMTVTIDSNGKVAFVEVKGESLEQKISEALSDIIKSCDFTALGINKQWQFIIKF